MKINSIAKPVKYSEHRRFNDTEHRGFNDKSEHNRKQNNSSEKLSFAEVLKEVKRSKRID